MFDFDQEPIPHLFTKVVHLYFRRAFSIMGDIGIHPGQINMLYHLSHNNGMSQRELSKKMMVKPPTITVAIQRMEKSGLVYRQPDPEDQRTSRVFLTDQGKEKFRQIEEICKKLNSEFISPLSEEQQDQLTQALQLIFQHLHQLVQQQQGSSRNSECYSHHHFE